ncbi:unnamed protein product [Discosporangium mesarthrocarpum]
MLLTEMVARTLKNIMRDFQRRWMKHECCKSDEGMGNLVVEFLNLVTGRHPNSSDFWEQKVVIGLMQRFGVIALTPFERKNLQHLCACPGVLDTCVEKLTRMQGVVLTPAAWKGFFLGASPVNFKFVLADIKEIRPIVKVG